MNVCIFVASFLQNDTDNRKIANTQWNEAPKMRLWPLNDMFLSCSLEFTLRLLIKGGLHVLPVTLKDTSLLVLLTESLWPLTSAPCPPPTCMCFSLPGTSETRWDFIYTLYYSYRGLQVWPQQETTEISSQYKHNRPLCVHTAQQQIQQKCTLWNARYVV